MSEQPHPSEEALPPSVVERLDKVCDRFEAAWKAAQSPGEVPRIEDYLGDTPEPERTALLCELIALDIAYRRRAIENPAADDYRARFPFLDLALLTSALAAQTAVGPDVASVAAEVRTHDIRGECRWGHHCSTGVRSNMRHSVPTACARSPPVTTTRPRFGRSLRESG